MMNTPFRLRRLKEYCTPKGPAFKQSQAIVFSIDGTMIGLKAPKHKTVYSSNEQIKPKRRYQLSEFIFRDYPRDFVKDQSWKKAIIFSRSWSFYGPWFTGPVAELPFSTTLIKATNKKSESYFHPRAFETAVSDFISQQYSHDFDQNNVQEWLAPIDWQPYSNGVRFKVTPNPNVINASFIREYAMVALTDDIILVFTFWLRQRVSGVIKDKDKMVNRQPLEDLVGDIIDHIKIDFSPEAQAQKDKALEGLEDASLSPAFAPLKWSNAEQPINTNKEPDALSFNTDN